MYLPRERIRQFESQVLLNRVLTGDTVSPEEIRTLHDGDVQYLWDHADPHVDLADLLARGPSYEDFERGIYPHRALLIQARRRQTVGEHLRFRPWSERFAEREQLGFWTYRSPDVAPGIEPHVLISQGMLPQEAAARVYPLRRLLIELGRPNLLAQARYIEAMEQKVRAAEQARAMAEQERRAAEAAVQRALGIAPPEAPDRPPHELSHQPAPSATDVGHAGIDRPPPTATDPSNASPQPQNIFRREAGRWRLKYLGQSARVRHLNGLPMLAHLLGRPWKSIPALELVRVIHPAGRSAAEADETALHELREEGLDVPSPNARREQQKFRQAELREAQASYLRRYRELEAAVSVARDDGDSARVAELEEEMERLTEEIKRGGNEARRTRDSSDPDEKARLAVRDNIRRAIERISEEHPALGEHLAASIKYGLSPSYQPEDPSTTWRLTKDPY